MSKLRCGRREGFCGDNEEKSWLIPTTLSNDASLVSAGSVPSARLDRETAGGLGTTMSAQQSSLEGVTVSPSHLLHRRLALRAEAADGAGVALALSPAGVLGQSRDAAEEGWSLGLQLERQVVQDTHAVLHRL